MPDSDALRDHLVRVLDWEEAHVGFDKAVDGIPPAKRGARAPGFERSPWQLLEHIRIAQEDILDFCINADYQHRMTWPEDYWPSEPAPPNAKAWTNSIVSYVRSRERAFNQAERRFEIDRWSRGRPEGVAPRSVIRSVHLSVVVDVTPKRLTWREFHPTIHLSVGRYRCARLQRSGRPCVPPPPWLRRTARQELVRVRHGYRPCSF